MTEQTKATMRQLLKEIQSGEFAKKWITENETGCQNFKAMRSAIAIIPWKLWDPSFAT